MKAEHIERAHELVGERKALIAEIETDLKAMGVEF